MLAPGIWRSRLARRGHRLFICAAIQGRLARQAGTLPARTHRAGRQASLLSRQGISSTTGAGSTTSSRRLFAAFLRRNGMPRVRGPAVSRRLAPPPGGEDERFYGWWVATWPSPLLLSQLLRIGPPGREGSAVVFHHRSLCGAPRTEKALAALLAKRRVSVKYVRGLEDVPSERWPMPAAGSVSMRQILPQRGRSRQLGRAKTGERGPVDLAHSPTYRHLLFMFFDH